jgi:hypothetical protein
MLRSFSLYPYLVYGRCWIQISARIPATLSGFHVLTQFLQENAGIVP